MNLNEVKKEFVQSLKKVYPVLYQFSVPVDAVNSFPCASYYLISKQFNKEWDNTYFGQTFSFSVDVFSDVPVQDIEEVERRLHEDLGALPISFFEEKGTDEIYRYHYTFSIQKN